MALHQPNTFQPNTAQPNCDGFSWLVSLADSVSDSDSLGPNNSFKALSESLSGSSAIVNMVNSAIKFEFVFLADTVTKSILNKGFTDAVRINDWLRIERTNSNWGN